MNRRFSTVVIAASALAVVCSWGCCHNCRRRGACPPPGVAPAFPAGPQVQPLPTPPPGQPPAPVFPQGQEPPPPVFPQGGPAPTPPAYQSQSPRADLSWQPNGKPRMDVRLSPPEGFAPGSVAPETPAYRPETPQYRPETPAPQATPAQPLPESPEPPRDTDTRPATPSLPVGIPQFTEAKARVSAGLTPFADGWDWLQNSGYRTVLHIRQPGSDDANERQQAEKRGLTYRTMEVSPQTLTRAMVDEFNRIVDDRTGQPLFVYDKDGVLAGAMWYLHFRTAEAATDQQARDQAERLGLPREPAGDALTMWLAVQKLLSQMNP